MIKPIHCVLAVLCLLPGFVGAEEAQYLDPHGRVLLVGSEIDYPPYADVDANGEATGFSVDLIKAVAKAVDLDIQFVTGPWNQVRKKLEDGEVDMLPLVGYSAARDEVFDFSAEHTSNMSIFLTREGAVEIVSIDEVKNYPLLVMQSDSTHDYLLQNNLNGTLLLKDTVASVLQALVDGEAQLAFLPEIPAYLKMHELGIENVNKTGLPIDVFYGKGFGFAVRQGNGELRHLLNAGLKIVELDGQYDQIYQKWFGSIIPEPPPPSPLIRYLPTIFTVISGVLVLLMGGIIFLRHRVSQQTHELSVRAMELESQNLELKALNSELEQFAHASSHDLKAPLKSIAGQLQMLQEMFADNLSDHAKQLSKNIDSNISRMIGMIDGLLVYAELSNSSEGRESINTQEMLSDVLSDLDGDIQASGALVEIQLNGVKEVKATRLMLRQVFANLISNAIKYRKPNEAPRITVTADADSKHWRFAVADNGIGIEEKFHQR
ncbi:MAG: transporter substrate-binding domain-containing protein, partial [Pseudomonadota bacterium]